MSLRARTIFGKLRRIFRLLASYVRAYLFFHGWRSYTWYEGEKVKLAGFKKRAKGREQFCADPFLFRHDGENFLFYETVDRAGKGKLGCLKMVAGKWLDQGIVLEETWHLSYPQVFEEGGKIYMIPESCDFGKGAVYLYEAVEFPLKWKRVKKLVDRPFADATILKQDGHWYMACYTIPPRETAELWHAPAIEGPWERHPQWRNINQSNRLRRCGGSFIRRGNDLYRVAQDCNRIYGKRMFMVKIDKITPAEYREGTITVLHDKSMSPYGYCHTYNEVDVEVQGGEKKRLCVVDVHYDSWQNPLRVISNVCSSLVRKILAR